MYVREDGEAHTNMSRSLLMAHPPSIMSGYSLVVVSIGASSIALLQVVSWYIHPVASYVPPAPMEVLRWIICGSMVRGLRAPESSSYLPGLRMRAWCAGVSAVDGEGRCAVGAVRIRAVQVEESACLSECSCNA